MDLSNEHDNKDDEGDKYNENNEYNEYITPSLKESIPAMKRRILGTLIFLRDSPRLSGINNF